MLSQTPKLHFYLDGIVEVQITEEMLKAAHIRAERMGKLKNSITGGEGNVAGFLGEYITLALIPGARLVDDYDYDLITPTGLTIDAKTCRTNIKPRETYNAQVAHHNITQDTDVYAFTRIKNDFSVGWLCGWIYPYHFYQKAEKREKGFVRDDGGGKIFKYPESCYEMPIRDLKKFKPGHSICCG